MSNITSLEQKSSTKRTVLHHVIYLSIYLCIHIQGGAYNIFACSLASSGSVETFRIVLQLSAIHSISLCCIYLTIYLLIYLYLYLSFHLCHIPLFQEAITITYPYIYPSIYPYTYISIYRSIFVSGGHYPGGVRGAALRSFTILQGCHQKQVQYIKLGGGALGDLMKPPNVERTTLLYSYNLL